MHIDDLLTLWENAEAVAAACERGTATAFANYRKNPTDARLANLSQALAARDRCRFALRSLAQDVHVHLSRVR
jgi:hypothetical protein